MPTFPRATRAKPRLATPLRGSAGLQSWGETGKGQFRAIAQTGRMWEEIYPVLDTNRQAVRALIAAINRGIHSGIIWTITHPYETGAGALSAVIVGVSIPNIDSTRYLDAGLTVTWREQV